MHSEGNNRMKMQLPKKKKNTEGGTLSSSFYEATITLRAKPDREAHTKKKKRKENDRPISLKNTDGKILNKILANQKRQSLQ